MKLNDIFNDYDTENSIYECKSRLDRDNILGWLKTIGGFANSKGGILFLGVENKTNKLIGFDIEEIDKEKIYFYNQIKAHFETMPTINIDLLPYIVNDKKRYIMQINILESNIKPIILKYQGMPMIYVRKDVYTAPATTEEIISMSLKGNTPKYDTQITDQKYDINNFKTLFSFYKENTNMDLKEKELVSINFFNKDKFLFKGSTLFLDDYNGEDTTIVCSLYKGLTRGDNQIIASNSFKGNLIDCYKYMWEFINQKMNHGFIKKDTKRIDIDSFPQRSVFEAIINSLAHRDYFLKGTAIYVDLFKNRLVISSPGDFYESEEIKKTYKLDSFISRRRNELICNIFILCKVMEAKGTGFEKILEDYKDVEDKHKPFIFSKNNQFSIVLPDLTYEDGVQMDEESINILKPISNSGKYDISILAFCYSEKKNVKEITGYLNISNSTFFRKSILNNLVIQGYLIEEEINNKKTYFTNHELVTKR
mgnify:FL=1